MAANSQGRASITGRLGAITTSEVAEPSNSKGTTEPIHPQEENRRQPQITVTDGVFVTWDDGNVTSTEKGGAQSQGANSSKARHILLTTMGTRSRSEDQSHYRREDCEEVNSRRKEVTAGIMDNGWINVPEASTSMSIDPNPFSEPREQRNYLDDDTTSASAETSGSPRSVEMSRNASHCGDVTSTSDDSTTTQYGQATDSTEHTRGLNDYYFASAKAPERFNGKLRGRLYPFLTSCAQVFEQNPRKFTHDWMKVTFACAYLAGDAFKWYEHHLLAGGGEPEWFYSWADFKSELQDQFGEAMNRRKAEVAICRLQMASQKGLAEYLVNFRRYQSVCGWNDAAFMHHFRRGLVLRLVTELSRLSPQPDTLQELQEAAVRLDQKYWESVESHPTVSHRRSHSPNQTRKGKGPMRGTLPEQKAKKLTYAEWKVKRARYPCDGISDPRNPYETRYRAESGLCESCGGPHRMGCPHEAHQRRKDRSQPARKRMRGNATAFMAYPTYSISETPPGAGADTRHLETDFRAFRLDTPPTTPTEPNNATIPMVSLPLNVGLDDRREEPTTRYLCLPANITFGSAIHPCLIDSGSSHSYIDTKLARQLRVDFCQLNRSFRVIQMDGSRLSEQVTDYINKGFFLGTHYFSQTRLYVMNLPEQFPMLLGIDFLTRYNPTIDWREKEITFGNSDPLGLSPPRPHGLGPLDIPGGYAGIHVPDMHFTITNPEDLAVFPAFMAKAIPASWQLNTDEPKVSDTASLATKFPLCPPEYLHLFKEEVVDVVPGPAAFAPPLKVLQPVPFLKDSTLRFRNEKHKAAFEQQIFELFRQGHIEPTTQALTCRAHTSSPITMDLTWMDQVLGRFNSPVHVTHEVLSKVRTATYFTKLRLRPAYRHVSIRDAERRLFVFDTPIGRFRWVVIPPNATNADNLVGYRLKEILQHTEKKHLLVVGHTIYVFSDDRESHKRHLCQVCDVLSDYDFRLLAKDCIWHHATAHLMGLSVSENGIQISEDQKNALGKIRPPASFEALGTFLEAVEFFDIFLQYHMEDFDGLRLHLDRRAKFPTWRWDKRQEQHFRKLLSLLGKATAITPFDSKGYHVLATHALPYNVCVSLLQYDMISRQLLPVIHVSSCKAKPLAHRKVYSKGDLAHNEQIAIVYGCRRLRNYLSLVDSFKVYTAELSGIMDSRFKATQNMRNLANSIDDLNFVVCCSHNDREIHTVVLRPRDELKLTRGYCTTAKALVAANGTTALDAVTSEDSEYFIFSLMTRFPTPRPFPQWSKRADRILRNRPGFTPPKHQATTTHSTIILPLPPAEFEPDQELAYLHSDELTSTGSTSMGCVPPDPTTNDSDQEQAGPTLPHSTNSPAKDSAGSYSNPFDYVCPRELDDRNLGALLLSSSPNTVSEMPKFPPGLPLSANLPLELSCIVEDDEMPKEKDGDMYESSIHFPYPGSPPLYSRPALLPCEPDFSGIFETESPLSSYSAEDAYEVITPPFVPSSVE